MATSTIAASQEEDKEDSRRSFFKGLGVALAAAALPAAAMAPVVSLRPAARARLTAQEVSIIRELAARGMTYSAIAARLT